MLKPKFTLNDVSIDEQGIAFQGYFQMQKFMVSHRLFEGGWSPSYSREMFHRGRSAALLPYDPVLDKVVLIEQFRIGALGDPRSPWLMEVVAGAIDKEGESAEQVVIREAQEEAGLDVTKVKLIHDYWVSPGGTSEKLALFCGQVDASHACGVHGLADEFEDIKVHCVSVTDALAAVDDGTINNSAAIIALQWLALNRDKLQAQWLDD